LKPFSLSLKNKLKIGWIFLFCGIIVLEKTGLDNNFIQKKRKLFEDFLRRAGFA